MEMHDGRQVAYLCVGLAASCGTLGLTQSTCGFLLTARRSATADLGVLVQCCMKVMLCTPPNELAQAFGNGGSVEFLLGQLLTSAQDPTLDEPQLRRIHVQMCIRTALGLHHIPGKLNC